MRLTAASLLVAGFVLASAVVLGGCAASPAHSPPVASWGVDVPEATVANPVVGRSRDSITLLPVSPRGATVGVDYAYDMPHCGIHSPIDVDGSFWDAVGIDPGSADFDGTLGTFRLVTPHEATFTRRDGAVLQLVRHAGAKSFGFCL